MILEDKDLKEVQSLVNNYSSVHKEIEILEESINSFKEKQDRLISELEDLRSKEQAFYKHLNSKYGEGSINVNTFEYELKNK